MTRKTHARTVPIVVAGVVLAGLLALSGYFWVERYRVQAERLMENRDWASARTALTSYLRFHPAHASARLMMAESLIRDHKLSGEEKVEAALEQLRQIADDSPRAAEARLQEGRLYLLLRLQPGRAERSFLRSLAIEPDRAETRILLWKLYDMTNRWDSAEDHFWTLCQQSPASDRAALLRDWYLSEFSPGTANLELSRRMGLLGVNEAPDVFSDRKRLEAFVASEPDWPEGYALLARWLHHQGGLQQASQQLDQAEKLPNGAQTPLVIATRVAVCLEMGEFDRARQALQNWPEPRDGYECWKTVGLIADQVQRDNLAACQAFEKAIRTTAGKSDWLIQHRLSQCLLRSGKTDEAARIRQQSKQVELLMEAPVHTGLRRALLTPRAPETLSRMIELYQQLGRDREVAAWRELTPVSEHDKLTPSDEQVDGQVESRADSQVRDRPFSDPPDSTAPRSKAVDPATH